MKGTKRMTMHDRGEELRDLASQLLDAVVLPGHAMAPEDWERLLIICGRYCHPYIAKRKKPPTGECQRGAEEPND